MRGLYIFVEGDDDERFIRAVVYPLLKGKYDWIDVVKYAGYTKSKLEDYFKSVQSIGADYIFLADKNNSPCITGRVEYVEQRWGVPDKKKIVIVVKEIESWYMAGADGGALRVKVPKNTEGVSKEKFDKCIPSTRFRSRIDFMREILKSFNLKEARRRNRSFGYFLDKLP